MSAIISRASRKGISRAARVPHEFRLEASRVEISRNEKVDLVIHAVPANRGAALLQAVQDFDDELGDEFAALVAQDRREQPAEQARDAM